MHSDGVFPLVLGARRIYYYFGFGILKSVDRQAGAIIIFIIIITAGIAYRKRRSVNKTALA